MADESRTKEAAHTAFTAAREEYAKLERTSVTVYQELEGADAQSGSSVVSRL